MLNVDSLISEMEKLLVSGREECNIQDIIGDSAGKNIDDLLIEADKIIGETLPFFEKYSNTNKVKSSKDCKSIPNNTKIILAQPQFKKNDTKKVIFNLKNNSPSISIPVKHPTTSETYGKLTINKHIKEEERRNHNIRSPSLKKCTAELKLKNNELEKNLMIKEQEIRNLENRYQQLSQYCESFLKKNIEETLKSYDFQLNELIERNMTRESQLHIIIGNLIEEIEQSHTQCNIKLSEKNKQICNYLDQIETILDNIYKFKNINRKI